METGTLASLQPSCQKLPPRDAKWVAVHNVTTICRQDAVAGSSRKRRPSGGHRDALAALLSLILTLWKDERS